MKWCEFISMTPLIRKDKVYDYTDTSTTICRYTFLEPSMLRKIAFIPYLCDWM